MAYADRARVITALSDVIDSDEVARWMRSPNRMLDWRAPDDVIAAGDAELVLDLIGALGEGVIF